MSETDSTRLISRRRALALGGVTAGTLMATAGLPQLAHAALPVPGDGGGGTGSEWDEIKMAIEQIIQADGMDSNGVFTIEIDRDDIQDVTLHGVPIKPSFQINGSLNFQYLGHGRVVMNSDMALKPDEIDPFIDQLLANELIFQAEHQHFYDFTPMVWFIHFRAAGNALQIARGIKAALNVTSTPFPQMSPPNPTTPLPADQLGSILGGSVSIGSDGVVTVDVPRADPIVLGGIRISPFLNVQTNIVFEPLGTGTDAAAALDFGMTAHEVQRVVRVMRKQGWDIGCLYNQETDEYPQLYFSHQFKTGDAVTLAYEIRKGLNLMNMAFM